MRAGWAPRVSFSRRPAGRLSPPPPAPMKSWPRVGRHRHPRSRSLPRARAARRRSLRAPSRRA
eukprot:1833857-Prymnesium_polylepis.1